MRQEYENRSPKKILIILPLAPEEKIDQIRSQFLIKNSFLILYDTTIIF